MCRTYLKLNIARRLFLFWMVAAWQLIPAQTPILMGPQTSTYSGQVRGYYFVAPVDFTICQLYVEDELTTAMQHVEVVRLNVVPPVFPATTNNFVSLFYQNNFVPNVPIGCNIPITAGQIIGVYGCRGNAGTQLVSYCNAPWVTPIYGSNATLYYSGMQFPLYNQQMHDIWYANFSRASRVTMYYDCVILPEGLIAFEGEAQGDQALLHWTASENAKWARMELERCREGEDFRSIHVVEPTSAADTLFSYIDPNPGHGKIYYRLRLYGQNGESTWSEVVPLQFDELPGMKVWPHPASTEGFYVRLQQPLEAPVRVALDNLQGQRVWEAEYGMPGVVDRLHVAPVGVSPGIYRLSTVSHTGTDAVKVVLQ